MTISQLFFSIKGRIDRKTYWCALFPIVIGSLIAEVLTGYSDGKMVWFGCIIMIALLWSSLAVQTKRWHDRNKSGWWNLIGFVPIVGPIWAFIELGFLQGTYGANRYDLRPAACPSYKHGLPISNTQEDTYIGEPQEEKEMVTQGSSVSNSWRNQ